MGRNSVSRIDADTWCIEEAGGTVYGFLLCGSERAVMIDTGIGGCDYRAMADGLTALPVDVINTHGHLDHVSGNYRFDRAYVHAADSELIKNHLSYEGRLGMYRMLFSSAGIPDFILNSSLFRFCVKKYCRIPVKDNISLLNGGDVIDLGGRTLEIIHTPGHTQGSVCILDRERRYLFSGDMLCDEGILLNFEHSTDVRTFLDTMKALRARSGDWDKIWPAHHLKPIGSEFIDEYIACAEEILAGQTGGDEERAGVTVHRHGRITLAYTADKL